MAASLSPSPSPSPPWAVPPSTSCTGGCPASLSPLAALPGPDCVSFTTRCKSGSSAPKAVASLSRLSARENPPRQSPGGVAGMGGPKPARKGRRRLLRACPRAKRGRRRAELAEELRSRKRPGIHPGWELEAVSPTLDGTREPRPSRRSRQPRAGTPRGTVAAVRPWAPCRGQAPGVPWWGPVRAPSPSPVLLQSPGTCSAAPNRSLISINCALVPPGREQHAEPTVGSQRSALITSPS